MRHHFHGVTIGPSCVGADRRAARGVCVCVCVYSKCKCKYVFGYHLQHSMDQPGKVANPACSQLNREETMFPVPVRAREFGLARQVRPSRPASACSFSTPRLKMVLITGFLPVSATASTYAVNHHSLMSRIFPYCLARVYIDISARQDREGSFACKYVKDASFTLRWTFFPFFSSPALW